MKSKQNDIKEAIDQISISESEKQQLNQAREHALNQNVSQPLFNFTKPILAYASLFIVVGLVSFVCINLNSETSPALSNSSDDFVFLTGQDSVEMVQDVEFYMWLESQNTHQKSKT